MFPLKFSFFITIILSSTTVSSASLYYSGLATHRQNIDAIVAFEFIELSKIPSNFVQKIQKEFSFHSKEMALKISNEIFLQAIIKYHLSLLQSPFHPVYDDFNINAIKATKFLRLSKNDFNEILKTSVSHLLSYYITFYYSKILCNNTFLDNINIKIYEKLYNDFDIEIRLALRKDLDRLIDLNKHAFDLGPAAVKATIFTGSQLLKDEEFYYSFFKEIFAKFFENVPLSVALKHAFFNYVNS